MYHNEGFLDVDFKYLGGLWVLFDFESSDARDKFLKHNGVTTWFSILKPWHDDFVAEERLIWLEVDGVPIRAWDNQELGDEIQVNKPCDSPTPDKLHEKPIDSNPFELDHLIKKSGKAHKPCQSETPEYPPGFSSILRGDHEVSYSIQKLTDGGHIKQPGFSVLDQLEETIKVGLALGLNMEGLGDLNKRRWICDLCQVNKVNFLSIQETKMLQVDLWMLRQIWGNVHFDFASTSARGMSGGIICLWNSLVFHKSRITCNDNYVVIDGLWIPSDVQVRWIVVYAPQNLSSKITLWSALSNLLANWDGISIVMGDFNKVRDEEERYGLNFYERQARVFNDFITENSLIDIPLGGFNFTWTNKWGTKMSKLDRFLVFESFYETFPHATGLVLEKGIPDHRPILLKESIVDYGPTPFRFFHSWLEMDGFHELVNQTWKNDGIVNVNGFTLFKKKLQNLKKVIRVWISSRYASDEDFKTMRGSLTVLGKMDRIEAQDYAQKAKIKWALEGDKNTSFFHGTLKKKRRQLAIRGILKNGDWIDAPDDVKEEFLAHFRNRFKQPFGSPSSLDSLSFNSLSQIHRDYLELPFSRDEIKRGVWDCGGERALGPDGFMFRFFTTFWDTIEEDVVRFVQEFSHSHAIPKGCNPYFIALIPKVPNAKFVSDFQPISLIGCQYKIIRKLLANRLSNVIGDCISPVKSAFIKGRYILDGPLILNEVLAEYHNIIKSFLCLKLISRKPLTHCVGILWMRLWKRWVLVSNGDYGSRGAFTMLDPMF
ncbi:putative RNA-directed DNA polymerase, eukaryota, reverse transcriptase zinc-binding domain protein [Tanacetum coccineum]